MFDVVVEMETTARNCDTAALEASRGDEARAELIVVAIEGNIDGRGSHQRAYSGGYQHCGAVIPEPCNAAHAQRDTDP